MIASEDSLLVEDYSISPIDYKRNRVFDGICFEYRTKGLMTDSGDIIKIIKFPIPFICGYSWEESFDKYMKIYQGNYP
jgi:hypothetical protein